MNNTIKFVIVFIAIVLVFVAMFYVTRTTPSTETGESTTTINTEETATTDFGVLPKYEMSFEHVKPGEYSEVYLGATNLRPEQKVTATLSGPSVNEPKTQETFSDQNGTAHFTWKIFTFGTYSADIDYKTTIDEQPIMATPGPSILVE